MLNSQQKLALIRQAEVSPGLALLTMLETLRTEMKGMIEQGLATAEASMPERLVLKHIEKLKGEKGDTPDENAIIASVTPKVVDMMLPEAVRAVMGRIRLPEDGRTPTRDELMALITPLIPSKAKDGKTWTKEELVNLIMPLIPSIEKDEDITEQDVVDLIQKHSKQMTVEDILKSLEPVIDSKVIEKVNNLPKGRKKYLHGGGDTVLAGTNITIVTNADGTKTITSTGGGGSGYAMETPS